jgi:hypothetical protein
MTGWKSSGRGPIFEIRAGSPLFDWYSVNRNGLLALATCLTCAAAHQSAAAQSQAKTIERARSGSLGARISILPLKTGNVTSGIEVGYARLADVRTGFRFGSSAGTAMVEYERSSRRMFHAGFMTRRAWFNKGHAGLYAGAGTGVYLVTNSSEFFEQSPSSLRLLDFQRRKRHEFEFGLNVGGGFELRPFRNAGAFDLDARFHLLPFAGAVGVRSVFTVSAGLKIF